MRLRPSHWIQIAGITFSILPSEASKRIHFATDYTGFLRPPADNPDVALEAHYGQLPKLTLREEDKQFESEVLWSLYHRDDEHVFVLRTPGAGQTPYRVALLDGGFRRGKVYSRILENPWWPAGWAPDPLEFPLSEALMICLLSRRRGLMVHACGVVDQGAGYLFAGNSTHGKTTIARVWTDTAQADLLNDDRVVVRRRGDRFRLYGTPWHGDCDRMSPGGVPLAKIFFLSPAAHNRSLKVEGASAAAMLLARAFPPLWDGEGMRFTLEFCSQLAASVPCYQLEFVPDKEMVDLVRCAS